MKPPRLPQLTAPGGSLGCRREVTERRVWGDQDRWEGHRESPEVGGVTAEAGGRTAQRDERAVCSRSRGQDRCPCRARAQRGPGSRHPEVPQQSSCSKELSCTLERTSGLSVALQSIRPHSVVSMEGDEAGRRGGTCPGPGNAAVDTASPAAPSPDPLRVCRAWTSRASRRTCSWASASCCCSASRSCGCCSGTRSCTTRSPARSWVSARTRGRRACARFASALARCEPPGVFPPLDAGRGAGVGRPEAAGTPASASCPQS